MSFLVHYKLKLVLFEYLFKNVIIFLPKSFLRIRKKFLILWRANKNLCVKNTIVLVVLRLNLTNVNCVVSRHFFNLCFIVYLLSKRARNEKV